MAVQASVTMYKKEMVAAFQQKRSLLSMMAKKESMASGHKVTWLINGNPNDTAVTRGQNGDIPYNSPTNNQVTATLEERHAPYSLTGFDVFASQGDQTAGMRDQSLGVINREMDLELLSVLSGATQDYGSGGIFQLSEVTGAVAVLGNAYVPVDEIDNMFGVISWAAYNYLMQSTEFTNKDYVDVPMFNGATRRMLRWAGINWTMSPLITGVGTSSEEMFVFHRDSLGYAIALGEDKIFAGYDEMHGRSWSRAELYHKAKILQNSGIIKVTHDGSAIVAS